MGQPFYLSFDLGTTRLKVAAIGEHGQRLGQTSGRHQDYQINDREWQSAEDWWLLAQQLCQKLMTQDDIDPDLLIACSVSGRAGAGVLVNNGGKVLVEPWSDSRHHRHLQQIMSRKSDTAPALYGATLAAKLLWLQENEPTLYSAGEHMLYGKDLLIYRLTGNAITDPISGPGMEYWPDDLTSGLGLDPELFPQVALPWEIAGEVTQEAAAQLGIPSHRPVAVGAHDGVSANIGVAALTSDRFAITLGTHCVVRTVSQQRPPKANRFYCYPPDQHVLGANAVWAGRALDWYLDLAYPAGNRDQLFLHLDETLSGAESGANGVRFLPFLGGRISPIRRPQDKAAFFGVQRNNSRQDLFQAVIEGASFAIHENLMLLSSWTGNPTYLGLTGSGMQSTFWTQTLADLCDHPLSITDAAAESRGAAILAAVATGRQNSMPAAMTEMVKPTGTIEPRPARAETLRSLYGEWQLLVSEQAKLSP